VTIGSANSSWVFLLHPFSLGISGTCFYEMVVLCWHDWPAYAITIVGVLPELTSSSMSFWSTLTSMRVTWHGTQHTQLSGKPSWNGTQSAYDEMFAVSTHLTFNECFKRLLVICEFMGKVLVLKLILRVQDEFANCFSYNNKPVISANVVSKRNRTCDRFQPFIRHKTTRNFLL